jgi:hypothetical protein
MLARRVFRGIAFGRGEASAFEVAIEARREASGEQKTLLLEALGQILGGGLKALVPDLIEALGLAGAGLSQGGLGLGLCHPPLGELLPEPG